MIQYVNDGSSILNSRAELIVIPVNLVGVMGAGLARQFADKWPAAVEQYKLMCSSGELKIGAPRPIQLNSIQAAIMFPTKDHYRYPSELEWIVKGLESLSRGVTATKWESIAIPALGCGLGELDWRIVDKMICRHMRNTMLDVFIYPPR